MYTDGVFDGILLQNSKFVDMIENNLELDTVG